MISKRNKSGLSFKEMMRLRNTTHGMANSPTNKSWQDMKARCNNPNQKDYKDYGGRGVTYCAKWEDFAGFYEDMGERPEKMSLDRIDVNGNYEKSNCRWADAKTQANNKRSNHLVTINGETKTLMQWSEIYGIYYKTVHYRLKRGYTPEQALSKSKLSNSGTRQFVEGKFVL